MTRIAATIVGTDDDRFRSIAANDDRLELARSIAAFTQGDDGADIVMLPAGFLTATDEDEAGQHAKTLAAIFNKRVLLAGVDEEEGRVGRAPAAPARRGKEARRGRQRVAPMVTRSGRSPPRPERS